MDVAELLANTLNANVDVRTHAEAQLEHASRENYPLYLSMLTQELAREDQAQSYIRAAAGLAVKNALSAREGHRQEENARRWVILDQGTKGVIKNNVLKTLGSQDTRASATAAQVLSAIASIELPIQAWPDLIRTLLGLISSSDSTSHLRQASLQAIGFICESIKPQVLHSQTNEILTAVCTGARKEEASDDVKLAALNALYNSLEFVRDNFDREGERNYIMQVVCEATQSSSTPVQIAAFANLVKIMQLYYDKMQFYMQMALYALTSLGMKHENEKVALQAVEFWSTVCDEEIAISQDTEDMLSMGETPEQINHNFALTALPEILPVLLELLTRQEEDADDDEWNVSMAAGTAISLLAQAVGDPIVPPIIPFIESGIRSEHWRQREAAVMAFGSILDGPQVEALSRLVAQALPILIQMMKDPTIQVRDTVAWTLGRISDLVSDAIDPQTHLEPLITVLLAGLHDSPKIIPNCSWSLMSLASHISAMAGPDGQSNALSRYYDGIVRELMKVASRADNENNSRTSAFEAISTYVSAAAPDSHQTVMEIGAWALQKMEAGLEMQGQLLSLEDRLHYTELQSNLCSLLTNIIRQLGNGVMPAAARMMEDLLRLMQTSGRASNALEDAFLAIGALCSALEAEFQPFLPPFAPYLFGALRNHQEYQLCKVSIGILGDICRSLGHQTAAYANDFMSALVEALHDEQLERTVKPPILSAFGDIALAIEGDFEPYLGTTMTVLAQASGVQLAEDAEFEMIEYVSTLKESIVEAYVGIVNGLRGGAKAHLILPYLQHFMAFLGSVINDENRTEGVIRAILGLVGDIAEAFPDGQTAKEPLQMQWVGDLLRSGRTSKYPEVKKTAKWAREMVKRATGEAL